MAATAQAAPADISRFRERKQMTQETPSENFTMIPNGFLDEQLAKIEHVTELKVTLAVIRLTIGYQKKADIISYSQFQRLTGLSPASVADGLNYALIRGLVVRESVGQQRWRYSLQPLASSNRSEEQTTSPRLVEPLAPGEWFDAETTSPRLDTKEKNLKENLKKVYEETVPASQEADAPATYQSVELSEEKQSTPSSRQVEVKVPGPGSSTDQGRVRAGGQSKPKSHIPPIAKPVPKPKKKEPDPTLQDPRLVMWRKYADLAGYGPWPNQLQRQMIIDTVPLGQLDRWEYYLKSWVGHGWQMRNTEDLLDYFVTGKQKKRGDGRG